jgi:hypothetical protein
MRKKDLGVNPFGCMAGHDHWTLTVSFYDGQIMNVVLFGRNMAKHSRTYFKFRRIEKNMTVSA